MRIQTIFVPIMICAVSFIAGGVFFSYRENTRTIPATNTATVETNTNTVTATDMDDKINTPTINTNTNNNSSDQISESTLQFDHAVSVTPDDIYPYGAFCRINHYQDGFFVTFGGSSPLATESAKTAGGAESGSGYSYKLYTDDLEYTGEHGVISSTGGDSASVYAEGYYYFLSSDGGSWTILKIDPLTWQQVDSVDVDIDTQHEATNDQMLAYANGQIIASSLYDPNNTGQRVNQKETDPTKGYGTHNHVFDLDLNLLDEFVLEDTPHINASSLVFVDGVYNYVTATAYRGDIIVMRYDEDWKYLGVQTIAEHGNWAQGTAYDPVRKQFYVSYVDSGELGANGLRVPSNGLNIALGVYDANWNLIEKVPVTEYRTPDTATGRPWVTVYNDKVYVSYDIATFLKGEENKDWSCTVSVYTQ